MKAQHTRRLLTSIGAQFNLMMAAAMAMVDTPAEALPSPVAPRSRPSPMQRTSQDREALQRAEDKRKRKALKRQRNGS